MARINLDEIDFKSMSYDETLKWFLTNIKEIDGYDRAHTSYTISYDKMAKILDCQKELEHELYYVDEYIDALVKPFEEDKDFFRKNDFDNYHPHHAPVIGDIYFSDYTDDIINAYLEYRYEIKESSNKEKDPRDEYYRAGNFEYKNHSLFINDEKIKLSPQELLIMRKFMSDQVSGVKYYNYDDICDIISTKNRTKINNMQKLISKLRSKINKKTKDFQIESKSSDGYTFSIKNIR